MYVCFTSYSKSKTLRQVWTMKHLYNIHLLFFFVNAISIPFILCLGILRCVFSKTWFGIFCSADRLPGAMQFCTIFLSVQNCNCIPSWSILKKLSTGYTEIALQLYYKAWYIISLHEVHLTHKIFILKMSTIDQMSKMMYLKAFQTWWYLLRFTFSKYSWIAT